MLSFTPSPATTTTIASTSRKFSLHRHYHRRSFTTSSTNNIIIAGTSRGGGGGGGDKFKLPFTPPPQAPPGEVFQPFRPPPKSAPPQKYRNLDVTEKLNVLRDRMGQWHEYAPLVSSLFREGFNPPSIEDATGMSGVEQNLLRVASEVRDSLISLPGTFPSDLLAFFDAGGGAELLYELRFLNALQRAAAAEYVVTHRLDPRGARDLARAMKDIARRRGDYGWEAVSRDSPGDCLSYTYFRQSREELSDAQRMAALEKALETAATEAARDMVTREMVKRQKKEEVAEEKDAVVKVPIVRLKYGEIAEATAVVLLPVVKEGDGGDAMALAPRRTRVEGDIGIVEADKGWARWAVLPGWAPLLEAAANQAVAIEVADGRLLPWRSGALQEEKVLVVADRREQEVVEEEGVYVVDRDGRLLVERGRTLLAREGGVKPAATVVMVVRPPKEEEDDQLGDEDWV